MPMNPRLLRPRSVVQAGSGFDADAQAYITAVESADVQTLEDAVKTAINDFVVGCKADGIWTAIKASCLLMGARTLSGALTPLVGTAPTNNGPFVSGDYDRETGLKGNAATKYLNANRAGNADGQDDVHAAVYVSEGYSTTTNAYLAAGAGTQASLQIGVASGSPFFRNRSSVVTVETGQSISGFLGNARSSSSQYIARRGGSSNTISQSSASPATANFLVFGRLASSDLTSVDGLSAMRCAFYSIGSNLNLALLESRVSTLYTAIGAAI